MTAKKKEKNLEDVLDPHREREVDKGLSAIFRDEGGAMPDLTTFEPLKSRWWLYALIAAATFVIVLLAAAWAGFSIFKPFRGFSGQGLALTIEGPERVSLGQETTYFINYQNRTSEPLAATDLRVSFPADFVIASLEPQPTGEGMTWKIGSLPVEGRGTITVRGTFTGALGTVTAIQVVGAYRPSSFNSDFEALATKVLNYTDSVLQGSLSVPVKILPGDAVQLKYTLQNSGSEDFDDLIVQLTLPEGFQIASTTTQAMLEGRRVRIPLGTLTAGASTTIAVDGAFASGVSGEAHLVAETGRAVADGTFLTSQRSETSFTVLAGDLALKLVVNGRDTDTAIAYGSTLRFTAAYENTAPEDLKDIQLHLRFEAVSTTASTSSKSPLLVNWKTLDDGVGGSRKGDTLTWTKEQIAALGRLPAREDGSIDVAVDTLGSGSGTHGLAMRVYVEAEISEVGDTAVNRVVRSAPLTLRYLTDAHLTAEARYYSEEGAPVGLGPLPPLVGQTTTYRVRWMVEKTVHELKTVKVKATLPKNTSWPNTLTVDAGEVTYDSNTRVVTWNLNRLPLDIDQTFAEFDVQLTPGESDANRFAQLLGETRLEAFDAHANETIVLTQPALTTDLQTDEYAEAKGVVRNP